MIKKIGSMQINICEYYSPSFLQILKIGKELFGAWLQKSTIFICGHTFIDGQCKCGLNNFN